MDKKELINSGKVKSVFTTDDDDKVIIEFRDDMTAGDGELGFNTVFFQYLEDFRGDYGIV